MSLLELKGVTISIGGRQPIADFDLSLDKGAGLAIVGRARSGKSLLAAAVAGRLPAGARVEGTAQILARVAVLADHAGVADLERVLAQGVELVVGDEPGAALPPGAQHALLRAMQLARRDRGIALLIFTRDFRLPLAMQIEAAILADGKLVERGEPSHLLEHPRHAAAWDLTGGNRPRTRTMAKPPIGEPLLELHGVSKRFGSRLQSLWQGRTAQVGLDNLTFSVRRGEAVGVLGGAGAGKSLLLRLIGGIGRASEGQFGFERHAYRGSDIPADARARLAFLLHNPHSAFNPDLAVGLTLTEPMRVEEQLLIEEQADRLVEVVRAVGHEPDVLGRLPASFTPFELQRLALARALVGRPSLIVLDEPTAMLDPTEQSEFLVLFNRVRADYGLTVLAASREFEVLRALSDRILVLDHGHIVEGGKPADLLESAQHEATRALLAPRYPEPPPLPEPVREPEPLPVPEPALIPDLVTEPEPVHRPMPAQAAVPPAEPISEAPLAPAPVVTEPEPVSAPSAGEVAVEAPPGALADGPLPADPAISPEAAAPEPVGEAEGVQTPAAQVAPPADPRVAETLVDAPPVPPAPEEAAPDIVEAPPSADAIGENVVTPEVLPEQVIAAEPASLVEPEPAALASEPVQATEPLPAAVEPEAEPLATQLPASERGEPPAVTPVDPAPETPTEPVTPAPDSADDGSDEPAEAGQVDLPAEGSGDGAGSVEPADDKPVR